MKRTSHLLPDLLYSRLKAAAAKQETTVSELIRRAVELYLKRNGL